MLLVNKWNGDISKVTKQSGDVPNRDVLNRDVLLKSSLTFKGMFLMRMFPK